MTLFKLKNNQLINLDHIVRISIQKDFTTKLDYTDLEFMSGLNVSLRDKEDLEGFWTIVKQRTPARA
jgi:hypothetical protein